MSYIVRISDKPNREELKWAMKFTVRMRDDYTCQVCGNAGLDVAHMQSRHERPDLEFEPTNARVLCRGCHLKVDHENGHRPSGRPVGFRHTDDTRAKMSRSQKAIANQPEVREARSERVKAQWDKQGRFPERDCENCGKPLERVLLSRRQRFCGTECRYDFQRGKPRSGW